MAIRRLNRIAPAAAILADSCLSADEKETSAHWDKVQLQLNIPTGFVSAPSMCLCFTADPLVCSGPWCNLTLPPKCDISSGWYHAVVTGLSTGAGTVNSNPLQTWWVKIWCLFLKELISYHFRRPLGLQCTSVTMWTTTRKSSLKIWQFFYFFFLEWI